jgi:hypothetical protein
MKQYIFLINLRSYNMAITGTYQDHHLTMYKDMLDDELQKQGSRLEQTVSRESVGGNKTEFEKVGKFTSYKKTSRNQKKTYQDATFEKRRVEFSYSSSDIVLDKVDLLDLIGNPKSDYVRNMVWELGRAKDEIIFDAISGTAAVITNGSSTPTALPAASKVAVNDHSYDPAAGTNAIGLTSFKLKEALKILGEAEVDVTRETIYCIAPQAQLMALTMDNQVVNSDFRGKKPLEGGPGVDTDISGFMGITFIRYEETDLVNTTDQTAYIYPASSVKLGIRQPLQIEVNKDITLVGNPDALSATEDLGAVRMYEEKVIQIACDPSDFVSS